MRRCTEVKLLESEVRLQRAVRGGFEGCLVWVGCVGKDCEGDYLVQGRVLCVKFLPGRFAKRLDYVVSHLS